MPTHSAHDQTSWGRPAQIHGEASTDSSHFYMTMVIARDGLLHHHKNPESFSSGECTPKEAFLGEKTFAKKTYRADFVERILRELNRRCRFSVQSWKVA